MTSRARTLRLPLDQAEELEAIAGVDEVSVNEVRPSDTDLIAAVIDPWADARQRLNWVGWEPMAAGG